MYFEELQHTLRSVKQSSDQADESKSIHSTGGHLVPWRPRSPFEIWKPAMSLAEENDGGISIPRRTQSLVVQPAWMNWAAEGHRRRKARPILNEEPLSHRRLTYPSSWYHDSPQDNHPSFGGRETDLGNSTRRKEEERKEEARRREEDARKREEEIYRMEKEVKKREEEVAKMEQDAEKREEIVKQKEGEARQKAEELSRKEEEVMQRVARLEEDAEKTKQMQLEAQTMTEDTLKHEDIKKMEGACKKETEIKEWAARLEEDTERTKQMQLEAQRMTEDALKKHEDVKKTEEEARKKELEMRKWAAQLEEDTERTKQMQLESQQTTKDTLKKREDVKKMEEEAHKKEIEIKEWVAQLEEDKERTKQMQLEAQRITEDNLKKHESVKRMEEEACKKEIEMREWAAQLEEDAERTKQMQLEAQKITEDVLKKQEDLKEMEDLMRQEVDSLRREKEVARGDAGIREGGNTLVAGGAFNIAEGDIHINNSGKSPTDKGIAKLFLKVASGAFHDSGELSDPLSMERHPNTRAAVIQEILSWLDDSDSPELVMWLHGATGSGKSAIAQIIAQVLSEQGQLSGSFFFARGSTTGRGDERRLASTFAYQLAKYLPETRFHIAMTVVRDPAIFDLALRRQVEDLLINPLWVASNAAASLASSRLFIIDGLDECRDADAQCRILHVFTTAVKSIQHQLPHKLLITSRSETHLSAGFNNTAATYRRLSLDTLSFKVDQGNYEGEINKAAMGGS